MARLFNATIKNASNGKLTDGRGLFIIKTGETGSWVYRYTFLGRRREMGLGAWPIITLAEARKRRDRWATVAAQGRDPIEVRNSERNVARGTPRQKDPTFAELVKLVFDSKKVTFRGDGTRGRWLTPLEIYMIPKIGKKPGSTLTRDDIVRTLRPIWKTKSPTANKALQRTRIILRSAKLMGFPTDPDIAVSAKEILGVVQHETVHTPSVPWQDIPILYESLPNTVGGNCNRFIILTLVRMYAARAARVSEVDFETRVWTVPADRVKGQKGKVSDFRVPLSDPAIQIVKQAQEVDLELIFPGARDGKPITDAAVEKALRALEAPGTPHGFRTSFRTWVQDTQACSWEVAEMVLGHRTGGIVERSYARSDLLDQRRIVMDAWTRFVTSLESSL